MSYKVTCKFCNKRLYLTTENGIYKHYMQKHFNELNADDFCDCLYNFKKTNLLSEISREIIYEYYKKIIELYDRTFYDAQFISHYNMITKIRKYTEEDVKRFFTHVLPWKLDNPNRGNSKELCYMAFSKKEEGEKYYNDIMLIKNPYYQHGPELSPFSTKHKRYKGMSEKEKAAAVSEFASNISKHISPENSPLHIEFYLKQGMSKKEARKALSKRQSTFSLEKCIKKYGETKGMERWKRRQEKWQNTLKQKEPAELERINRAKMAFNGFSNISQRLFIDLYDRIKNKFDKIYFATLDPRAKVIDNSGISHEYLVVTEDKRYYFLDFYIPEVNKAIEFDGWYWHHGKGANKKRAAKRKNELIELGYDIYHVEEFDYRKNPEETIQKCIDYINS